MKNNNSNINLLFSTPVWTYLIPNHVEINTSMHKYIKSLQKKNPDGKHKSNIKGWHSENFDLNDDKIQYFIKSISNNINSTLNDMAWDLNKNKIKISSMWSIINYKDSSNSRHIHSNNFISAAYYVKAPKDCGKIIFYDPRSAATIRTPVISSNNELNSSIFSVEPKEGLLVLFPSYLHHSVERNNSDSERIVISFNINLI